jgi:hypothetical protein
MSDRISIEEIKNAIRANDLRTLRALLQKSDDNQRNAEIKKLLTEFHFELGNDTILGHVLKKHLPKYDILNFLVTHPDVNTNAPVNQYNKEIPLDILIDSDINNGSWKFLDVIVDNLHHTQGELIKFAENALKRESKTLFHKLIEKALRQNWDKIKDVKSQAEIFNILSEGKTGIFIALGNIKLQYQTSYKRSFDIFSYIVAIKASAASPVEKAANIHGITGNSLHIYHKRILDKYNKENQKIKVVDIIVKQTIGSSKGEFGSNITHDKATSINKIKDQITLLAKIADQYNRDHFDKNTITRLITPEFMFYTNEPMYEHEFEDIVNHIKNLAANLSNNLFLVFSSFAVYATDENGKVASITNKVIHVQCEEKIKKESGEEYEESVKIDIIAKVAAAAEDPFASKNIPFDKVANGRNEQPIGSKNKFSPYEYTHTSILLGAKTKTGNETKVTRSANYGFPILAEIASGAKFISIIDICIGVTAGEAVKNYYAFIEQLIADKATLIPTNLSQIITSNSIYLRGTDAITDKVAYVDAAHYPQAGISSYNFMTLDENIRTQYPSMYRYGTDIYNPPFGSNINILICQKYELKPINECQPLATKIKEHNIKIIYGLNMQHVPIFKNQIPHCAENIAVVIDFKNIIQNYYPAHAPQAFYHFIAELELAIPRRDFTSASQTLLQEFIKNLHEEAKDDFIPQLIHELQDRAALKDGSQIHTSIHVAM